MQNLINFIMAHWLLVSAFLLAIIVLLALEVRSGLVTGANALTPSQAIYMINNEKGVVIDIRELEAFKAGHIVNALSIPSGTIDTATNKKLGKYKKRPIIVMCAKGQHSAKFVKKLKELGFEQLYFITGGIQAWIKSNMPIVKK